MLLSCSSDDSVVQEQEFAKILSFKFLASNNDDLQVDISATINESNKTITAILPAHTPITFLKPLIKLSKGVNVFPNQDFPENFTNPVVYKVSGDNYRESKYTVTVIREDSKESNINSFVIKQNANPNLELDISGSFDDKIIRLEFNAGTDITALIPEITISQGAIINPENGLKQDFTNPIEYTITAQDGVTKKTYTVVSSILKSKKNEITSFVFPDINGQRYEANIVESNIVLELPEGTNLSGLIPTIETSLNANVSPESGVPQTFENLIQYEVTAEDGSKQTYTVNVYTANSIGADRVVLTEFYEVNKKLDNLFNGYLNWDLSAPTMENWEGVDIINGRVSSLSTTFDIRVYELPPSIGKLSELKFLSIGSFALQEIPKEIGNLKKLSNLHLTGNLIKELPKEIGELSSLLFLILTKNKLKTIPPEVGKLENLRFLYLDDNNLEVLPNEIEALSKLRTLKLERNPITIIPKEICALSKENGGNTEISLDIDDTCEE